MARILIVEDDPTLARTLRIALGTYGHHTRTAHGIAEAVSILNIWIPDLVLTDLTFPKGSAMQLIGTVTRMPMAPAIIVLTGINDIELHRRLVRAGVDHVSVKASDSIRCLIGEVEDAVRRQRSRVSL